MRDPLDVLHRPQTPVPPDPAFRQALLQRLKEEMEGDPSVAPRSEAPRTTPGSVVDIVAESTAHRYRSYLVVAFATAVAVLLLVLLRPTTDSVPPALTVPPVVQSTSTSTSISTSVPAVADDQVAQQLLLSAKEYGQGWRTGVFKEVVLDASLAQQLPGCAAYVDVVFESQRRPAATAWSFFQSPINRPPAQMSQYVVVFPTEAAATAMFDAAAEPQFADDCFSPYQQLSSDPTGYCCDPSIPFTPPLTGDPVQTGMTYGADAIVHHRTTASWIDEQGNSHGPETIDAVTMRIGRSIVVIEAIRVDESGQPYLTDPEFNRTMRAVVRRARGALP